MKEKIILTDADGVLCRWWSAFESYAIKCGHIQIPNTEHHYNLSKRFEADVDEMRKLVIEFNESEEIANLKPLTGAVDTISNLTSRGFRFVCITSLSDAPSASLYREENLLRLFGDVFDDIICLPVGQSKGHILERWADSGLFWLEDHFMNAEAGYEVGLNPILFDDPTNRNLQTDLFPRVTGPNLWKEVEGIILDEYELTECA